MCGIAGLISRGGSESISVLRGMTDMLRHRGPDGEGIYNYENAGIGHRRLSIIDLKTGRQPLCNEDGTIWITFNGEIYNYIHLRAELQNKGHRFHTHSDTETIIHAYEEWGVECLKHLRGMFAFGILDQRKREIFLARDHFGIKPLVYFCTNNIFAFASEIQALRAIKGVQFDIDYASVDSYLQFQFIPSPGSIFRQVRKLPAAHFMRVDMGGNIIELKRYWQLDFRPDDSKTEIQWLEELDEVLRDSVQAHLVSDVPFGAFLSGGIDSSTVVGYMAQLMNRQVKTFCIGFEEDDYNETQYARQVASKWNTEHFEEIVKPDALGILPQLVKHYGEPFGDSSAVPTWYVSKLAREHVTMVLTGDAGDEMFAGYESYTTRWNKHITPVPEHLGIARRVAYKILNRILPNRFPLRSSGFNDWLRYIQTFNQVQRNDLWRNDISETLPVPNCDVHNQYFLKSKAYSHFQRAQFTDFNTYMDDDILCKVDIASMMHSLETRTPLLDIKVVEFAATIPEEMNIRKVHGDWTGKLLLKKLGERYYPKEFLYRKKMGFAIPVKRWLLNEKNATNEVKERLLSQGNGLDLLFDNKAIHGIIATGHAPKLWMLLFLQEWLSQN